LIGWLLCEWPPWCHAPDFVLNLSHLFFFFLVFGNFDFSIQMPVYGSKFLPGMLVYSVSGSLSPIFRDLHKILCTLNVRSMAELRHVRYTTPNKRM
jgi:hypothetical protein